MTYTAEVRHRPSQMLYLCTRFRKKGWNIEDDNPVFYVYGYLTVRTFFGGEHLFGRTKLNLFINSTALQMFVSV